MLYSNCSYDAIKGIKFGYGFMANQRTFKIRYTTAMAILVMAEIPKHFHRDICVFVSAKGYTFLTIMAHPNHAIWQVLESARIKAKATSLRTKADMLEFGEPIAQLDLPF